MEYIINRSKGKYLFCNEEGEQDIENIENLEIDKNNLIIGKKVIYDKDKNTVIFKENLIKNIGGILHLSSVRIYSTDKQNVIKKEFTSFNNIFPKLLIKTKKTKISPDIFCIIELNDKNNEGCVKEYFDIDRNYYDFLRYMSISHWSGKINKLNFDEYENIDLTPDRLDMTDKIIYSIDPIGCEDIDDALHVEEFDDYYEIGIHIADPTSYIIENSELDKELSIRCSSVYLNKTYHMIPQELCLKYISLFENQIKRAFSVIIKINKLNMSQIIDISFKKTLINVKKNMSYEEAEKLIDKNTNKTLNLLYKIGSELKNNYVEIINYDIHEMVAVYMILANNKVAEFLYNYDPHNALLRTHKKTIFNKISEHKLAKKYMTLKMNKANYIYSTPNKNLIHSGLNLEYYTHMTSPIRRYADQIVHRDLYKAITNRNLKRVDNAIDVVFRMNFYDRYYGLIERYMNTVNIVEKIKQDEINEGYIIGFLNGFKMSILVYIEKYDINIDVSISDKIKILDINYDEINENIIIKNNTNNKEMKLYLFDKINVKLNITHRDMEKIHANILELNEFIMQ